MFELFFERLADFHWMEIEEDSIIYYGDVETDISSSIQRRSSSWKLILGKVTSAKGIRGREKYKKYSQIRNLI